MNIIIVALLLLGVCSKASISVRVALEKNILIYIQIKPNLDDYYTVSKLYENQFNVILCLSKLTYTKYAIL